MKRLIGISQIRPGQIIRETPAKSYEPGKQDHFDSRYYIVLNNNIRENTGHSLIGDKYASLTIAELRPKGHDLSDFMINNKNGVRLDVIA